MRTMVSMLIGAIASLFVLGGVGLTYLKIHADGFSARSKPSAVERSVARRARGVAMPVVAKKTSNPVPNSPEVLEGARVHWADHCAVCHANDGSGDTQMGKNMYPPVPDMREPDTQHLTDGELFYIIQNGIRFTGMPGWGSGSDQDAEDSWKLVHFIRHLPNLTLEERKQMEKLNPKGPDEWKEEEEEERFLKGETSNEPQPHHHH